MRDSNLERHLTPAELIDLLDGAPVDAAVKQHMTGCRECAEELGMLEETLSQLHSTEETHPGENYWQEFDATLQRKIRKTTTAHRGRSWYWYVAASASFAILSWQMVNFVIPERVEPPSIESVLPAVEEDAEFLFLVAIIELSGSTEDLEVSAGWGSASSFDLTQLTAEETERFRRELEEEMGDENGKS